MLRSGSNSMTRMVLTYNTTLVGFLLKILQVCENCEACRKELWIPPINCDVCYNYSSPNWLCP
jgi:hypothetical protein